MTWTYEGYWNTVLGSSRNAADVVREFDLDTTEERGLDVWLGEAEMAAWLAGTDEGDMPAEWLGHHTRALAELCAAVLPRRVAAMTDLCHYTLNTGDLRRSPRSEVRDDIITLVTPYLRPGVHPLPWEIFPGYSVRTTVPNPGVLAVDLSHDGVVLVTWSCYRDPGALGYGRERLESAGMLQPGADIWAPACLVTVLPTCFDDPALHWAGDLERCIAWAWVEFEGRTR